MTHPYKQQGMVCCCQPVHVSGDVDVVHETLDVQRQVRRVGAHEFLQFFTLLVEPDQSSGLGLHIQFVLLAKLLNKVFDQHLVEILPSQLWVAGCGQNLRGGRERERGDETRAKPRRL